MNFELEQQFNRDGFLVVKNLLELDFIDQVRGSIKRNIDDVLIAYNNTPGESLEVSLSKLFKYDTESYKKVVGSLWRKIEVYDLLHSPSIRKFLIDTFSWGGINIPGGQVVHIMGDSLRIPGGYHGISAHQDWPSVMGSLDGLVVWTPLQDITEDLFPLEVIPGSHKMGMMKLTNNQDAPWEVDPSQYKNEDFVKVLLKKGDVVFMSYFTLHQSSLSGSKDAIRLACSTRYDNTGEKNFIRRCFPTAYIRTVDRKLYLSENDEI